MVASGQHFLEIAVAVIEEALAGLDAEVPALDALGETARRVIRRRFHVVGIGQVRQAQIETGEVVALHEPESHGARREAGLDGQIELLRRDIAVVEQKEDLTPDAAQQTIDAEARDEPVHDDGRLAKTFEQAHHDEDGLVTGPLAPDHLDERDDVRRSEPVRDDGGGETPLRHHLEESR